MVIETFIKNAEVDEQKALVKWIQTKPIPGIDASEPVRDLVLTQLAYLGPFLDWTTLEDWRRRGIGGVHVPNDPTIPCTKDDFVQWFCFILPQSARIGPIPGKNRTYLLRGEAIKEKDRIPDVEKAVKSVLCGENYCELFSQWHRFQTRPQGRMYSFRGLLYDGFALALLCGAILLVPLGWTLSQGAIRNLATVLLIGSLVVIIGGLAWMVEFAVKRARDRFRGKREGAEICERLDGAVICWICRGNAPKRADVEGRSFLLPLGLSFFSALCRNPAPTHVRDRSPSIWDDIGDQIEKHLSGTAATGDVESSGKINSPGERLEDKHEVARKCGRAWFICPSAPNLGKKTPPCLQISHFADAVLCLARGTKLEGSWFPQAYQPALAPESTRRQARLSRWGGKIAAARTGLRYVFWGLLLFIVLLGGTDLCHLAWPPDDPTPLLTHILPVLEFNPGEHQVVTGEHQAIFFYFIAPEPSLCLASYYGGFSWAPVFRMPLKRDPKLPSAKIAFFEVPVILNGIPGTPDRLILERRQHFLAWELTPVKILSTNTVLYFPKRDLQR